MWVVLDLAGEPLATFKAGLDGWRRAVRYAERQGGELDVVFMAHFRLPEYRPKREAA